MAIVMSFEERTSDKTTLCDVALRRMGTDGDRSTALLIDNRLELVERWRDAGGAGYWYRGDDTFEADLERLLD